MLLFLGVMTTLLGYVKPPAPSQAAHPIELPISNIARFMVYNVSRVDYAEANDQMWDIERGECLQTFTGHYGEIYAVAFDGEKVVTGSLDSTVRVWSAATG